MSQDVQHVCSGPCTHPWPPRNLLWGPHGHFPWTLRVEVPSIREAVASVREEVHLSAGRRLGQGGGASVIEEARRSGGEARRSAGRPDGQRGNAALLSTAGARMGQGFLSKCRIGPRRAHKGAIQSRLKGLRGPASTRPGQCWGLRDK